VRDVRLGVRWPEYDLPLDVGMMRTFVAAAEDSGYEHITMSDFVIVPERDGAHGAIELKREEALTVIACMSGMANSIGFMTTVLTLPKRQTVLVAEMAATIDRLTNGRFRLGVGVGDQRVEYDVLGADFATRGARFEEQIGVLHSLWSGASTSTAGNWHALPPVDVVGSPAERKIPIWIAAGDLATPRTLQRIGRLADGIVPPWAPDDRAHQCLQVIETAARDAGRDYSAIGLEPKIALRHGKHLRWRVGTRKSEEELATEVAAWLELGATHLEFKTRRCGLATLDQHLDEMVRFREIVKSLAAPMV
jgi:probable F420-dependent oxidoreductase